MIAMGGQGQMSLNDGLRGQRGLIVEDGDDVAGSLRCFQEERVAGGPAQLGGTGVVEAMVDTNGGGAGFMCRGDQLSQDGPVPWSGPEL
ncbi:MAG: hypothetical protein BVN29_18145, partial [Nitrospira sp. ST-bin5]